MKKFISVILALVVIMSLGTAALAAEGDQTGVKLGSYTTEVMGTYVPGTTESEIVFSVDITWSAMSFTYKAEKAAVWDPVTHTYSEKTPATWEGEGTITVTNHSNTQISAVPAFAAAAGFDEVSMKFSPEKLTVDTAETGNKAQSGTITVTPSGDMTETKDSTKIGTITVTIDQDSGIIVGKVEQLLGNIDAQLNNPGDANQKMKLSNLKTELEAALTNFNNKSITQAELNSIYNEALETYNTL